jgi:hypothetical protein
MYEIGGGTTTPDGTATISLDPTGRLVGLCVTPTTPEIRPATRNGADWSQAFRLARLNESEAVSIPLRKRPPVDCDEVAAWRVGPAGDGDDELTLQIGTLDGRLNYVEILGLDEAMIYAPPEGKFLTTMSRNTLLIHLMRVVMLLLAWRNLRLGRGDWRNAIRYAAIVGALYTLLHVFSIFLQEGLLAETIRVESLRNGNDVGHALLHMADVWMIYVAIEPYVRRIWPRMLVGVVRTLTGRVRDPAVGREVLIGAVVGSGLGALAAITTLAQSTFEAKASIYLPHPEMMKWYSSPTQFTCMWLHRAAWSMLDVMRIAAVIVAIRILVRYESATLALGAAALGFTASQWFTIEGGEPWWIGLPYALSFGVAVMLLFTRVGVLAAMVALFVLLPHRLIGLELEAWYTPYGIARLGIPLGVALYGFWIALAGQPILKDMLAEPEPAAR